GCHPRTPYGRCQHVFRGDWRMWRHVDSYRSAARALGVELIGPTQVRLPSGTTLDVDMYFPNFGPLKGMIVVTSYDVIKTHRVELLGAGYGYSTFAPPIAGRE